MCVDEAGAAPHVVMAVAWPGHPSDARQRVKESLRPQTRRRVLTNAVMARKSGPSRRRHADVEDLLRVAINRETRLKKYKRRWKLELIEQHNPAWADLYERLNA